MAANGVAGSAGVPSGGVKTSGSTRNQTVAVINPITYRTTVANTGLSISRNGNKFTATWKIATGDPAQQWVRYRRYDRSDKKWTGWVTKEINKKATSYSFTADASKDTGAIQVQTSICRNDINNADGTKVFYWQSAFEDSSKKVTFTIPPKPTLAMTINNANKTTFAITSNAKTSGTAWQYRIYYRTKLGTADWSSWTYASQSSYVYTDNVTDKLRQFEVKAVGPAGQSGVAHQHHYIGNPPAATLERVACSAHPTGNPTYYVMTYRASLSCKDYMIDKIIPEYFIGVPTTAGIGCTGASFTAGQEFAYDDDKSVYILDINSSDVLDLDECLWAHVKTDHDGHEAISNVKRVLVGKMKAPSCTVTMGTPTPSGFSVSIDVTDFKTAVPDAYAQVYLSRKSKPGVKNYIGPIGTIAQTDTMPKTITSTEDITGESGYSILIRNVSADGKTMKSDYDEHKTSMPSKPTSLKVEPTDTQGKVYLSWTNNWSAANGEIISWTDDPDDWTSNTEPEQYEVTSKVKNWYIKGLDVGKRYYFRVMSTQTVGDSVTMSDWSDEVSVDLSSAPITPTLFLSEDVITEDDTVTAYWSYMTGDGTAQISGKVYQGTVSGGVFTATKCVGATSKSQHVDIKAKKVGWTNGNTYTLALKTGSASGGVSEYSTPVQLTVAAKPTVTISSTGLSSSETVTEMFVGDGATTAFQLAQTPSSVTSVKVDGTAAAYTLSTDTVTLGTAPADGKDVEVIYATTENKILTATPFNVVCATTNSETLTIAIERAEDYPMIRPDGSVTEGPAGETVYLKTFTAEASVTTAIDITDCFGRLDDGAYYNIVCTVRSPYGQTAEATQRFKVHWTHQAWVPTATGSIDPDEYIAKIKPVAGADYASGDTCDIYRLSVDAPELIYKGAAFGTTYVDPYPAFTIMAGYAFVTVTKYGDYITEDGEIAEALYWSDLDPKTLVIDFGGDRVELPYNITLSSTWAKDHKRTTYLGGSVVGDYNKAVTRDVSAGTVLVRNADEDLVQKMHALAMYTGHCHVRTPDGSSFEADVQVQESRAYNSAAVDYSLTIQKTDTTGFDGMTEAQWNKMHEEES